MKLPILNRTVRGFWPNVAAWLTLGLFAVAAVGEDSAQAVVDALHDGLIQSSSNEQTVDLEQRYVRLTPLISSTHDLPYIAELTIRRQWRDLDESQRARFVSAFARLSVMTYASRFATVGEDAFKVFGTSDAGSERVQVSAAITRAEAQDVSLDYTLHTRNDRWQIVNILADGVSDLALKRAEYSRILADGTIDDLIEHLEKQIADLE